MIATTNVTMRVDRTTFIASHSYILATTKKHLPKIATSLGTTWVGMPATHSLGDPSLDRLLEQKTQQQIH
jgi:hypothetical protein